VNLQSFKNIYHGIIAYLAAVWYGFPSKELTVIGVTGTDGKSTTIHLVRHILKSAGKKASMVSSVYAEIGGKQYDTGFHVTTPDSFMLQKFLRQAVAAGDKYMVLEVTSHGIDQNRILGIKFQIAVLTNVTHEHLDYHKTYENYVRTKIKLLERAKVAVVNKDDESYRYLSIKPIASNTPKFVESRQFYTRIISVSLESSSSPIIITYSLVDKSADLTPKKFSFTTPLLGEYNRYNCLAAICVAQQLGLADTDIKKALKSFTGIKGRFELIPSSSGLQIIIDFAHTPNAFAKVLPTARKQTSGKLIHIFGSAGLRDYTKRPLMGWESARYVDYIILTEEDYRTEDVNQIIDEIANGCKKQGAKEFLPKDYLLAIKQKSPVFFRVSDRQAAIIFAVTKLARKNDTVILTGKAHEKSLCRGTTEYPWSEHEAVAKALKQRK